MLSCKKVVTSYISWEVNKGDEVKFWEDSWNGNFPLKDCQELQSAIPILSQLWGSRLIDYFSYVEASLGRVSWKDFSST